MKRLTRRNNKGVAGLRGETQVLTSYDYDSGEINESGIYLLDKAFDKLAKYEDLEEQGLLLKLPCKVGDTVWCVDVDEDDYSGMIFMGMCGDYVIVCSTYAHLEDAFDAQIAEMALESKENYGVEVYIYHKDDVFLTREEAEAKLKEMEE